MKLAFIDIGQQLFLDEQGTSRIGALFPSASAGGSGRFLKFFWPIIKNIYILTGIVLFFMIVIGGVGMIANAGNPEKQKQSSQTLTSAVIGFLIMFVAYWIIKIIEIITGIDIFI